ncbi:histidine kinase dimerization/phosphoacceptor domain -containing protein [soil metagenome]
MNDTDPFNSVEDSRTLAQAIVDTIREPLLVLDKNLRVVAASRSFFLTFKMNRQDVQGRPIYALGNGEWDIPELRLLLERILPQHSVMEDYEVEHVFSAIGLRHMVLNARTVFYEEKGQALILLSIEDVTHRRTNERKLADLLAEKETLLQEMQHRVANSLQIIASILLLKARTVQSDETRLHLHDAHRRVMSVAAVQKHLQPFGHGERFAIAPYLSQLCETLAASMIGEDHRIRVEVRAGAADVSSTEAVSIGLMVTELVINALKHAFSQPTSVGLIVVSYEVADGSWRLTVSDNGAGKSDGGAGKSPPGLGTSIVEALAKQLEGRVDTSKTVPHGMTVSITHGAFPSHLQDAA